jgi:anti-anti-sigma regulatory factor
MEVTETDEEVVLRLRGQAGVVEAGALETSLVRLVSRRPAYVIFDLSELRLLSSLAMGVLAEFRRAAVRAGARVCLAPDLHPAARTALTRAELLDLFEVLGGPPPGGGPRPVTPSLRKLYPDVDEVQRIHALTWGQLVELEPQLETLLWRTRSAVARCRTLTEVQRSFGPVRNELAGLLGFAGKHQRHPVLGSAGAYAVAYWKLYDAVAGLLPGRAGGTAEAPEKPAGEAAAPFSEEPSGP